MTQTEYDKAKQECLSDFCKEHGFIETADVKGIFGYAFDRAYALGKQEVKRHVSVKEACEILGVDESEATTLVKSKPIETCTDDCSSPDHFVVKDEMVDNIIKDGFKNHNRLHIAAILAAGMLASEVRCYPVDRALELADKLIAECEKGDNNA